MVTYTWGSPSASTVLIQLVGEQDPAMLQQEAEMIQAAGGADFFLIAVKVEDWNRDLTPWKAPVAFGTGEYGEGAERTLEEVLTLCEDPCKSYYLGGYSLAGLFALWAAYQTETFHGVAAVSPSVWYPDLIDYIKCHEIKNRKVYLSLGDKEEKTRNRVMAAVGDRIRETYNWLQDQGVQCTLEWNPGGHFKDTDMRMAKAFGWLLG